MELFKKIMEDIRVPDFYENMSDTDHLVLYYGSNFVDKPHYLRYEQLLCAVGGALSVGLVPHINRQELYLDNLQDSIYFDSKIDERLQRNVSPVNFF